MLSSTALVCIVDLTSIVDLICVCWNLTYTVELLPSVISLQEPLPHYLWISLDHHGILAIVWTPAYPAVSICVCWPPKRRVYNITSSSLLHRKYLLLLCCLLKVSQYRLALIDTASVHIVKGISQHIHNRRWMRACNWRLEDGIGSQVLHRGHL